MPNDQLTIRKDIRNTIESMRDQFAMALPKLLKPERFLRVALTCVNKNPKLALCTKESLLACLLDCAALGIEPDGRRAHLIPYGDKCTLIIDYKGIAELVRRSGEVSDLHSDVICENDEFDYLFGTGSFLKHKIDIRKERGAVIGAYSYVKLKDGSESFDVMGVSEIEKIRQRSRSGNNGPWVTDKAEMQKKTIFRRHSKWLPLSPELRDKIEIDDDPLTETERFVAAKPVASADIQFGPALPQGDAIDITPTPEPEKPKRHRRTKAEIEAEKDVSGGVTTSETAGPESKRLDSDTGGRTESPREDMAPSAPDESLVRPLAKLRTMLMKEEIHEAKFQRFLITEGFIEPSDTLDKLPDDKLSEIIVSLPSIKEDMDK